MTINVWAWLIYFFTIGAVFFGAIAAFSLEKFLEYRDEKK